MPEFFKIDEYKKIDEYQKIEAENYSKSKELFDSAEFKNDIEEFQTSDDKKINIPFIDIFDSIKYLDMVD